MRFIWTDAGDDPDFNAGDKAGINGYFYPMFDALTTKVAIQDTRNRGYQVGLYMGNGWAQAQGSPADVAARASEEYKRCYISGLRAQFNWEQHDPGWIATFFEEWRKLRTTVGTSWSLEGMQGGWMSKAFVTRIINAKVRVVPEGFVQLQDRMGRWAEDMILRDLTRRGFPENLITLMYDAHDLPLDWDGYAFTMGRLPV